jgi:phospholipid/cholesterol/gamma-HCH transport system ATP-binding protein
MVHVAGLTKSFGSRVVLSDISFEVPEGSTMALMGSSGGGKTTLLRCLSGLIRPDQGTVAVDGVDVLAQPEEARRRMGMVFQHAALFDYMTVRENILFGVHRRRQNVDDDALVREVLEQVRLDDVQDLYPSELSGGMRKRVGIARALALRPRVLLFDEPTTGLDPITTYAIDELLVEIRAQGVTSVLVSHDVQSVARTADAVGFLHQGSLVFVGPPEEFLQAEHPAIRELVDKSQASSLSPR